MKNSGLKFEISINSFHWNLVFFIILSSEIKQKKLIEELPFFVVNFSNYKNRLNKLYVSLKLAIGFNGSVNIFESFDFG